MVIVRDHHARQTHYKKIGSTSFEMVERFEFLGKIIINQFSLMKKQTATGSQGMLATIRCGSSVFLFSNEKYRDQDTQNCSLGSSFV